MSTYKQIYSAHKETIHNYFWRSLQIFGKQGIAFFIYFVSAKFLPPSDFGLLSYLMTSVFFLILFCDFGISTAITKYISEFSVIDKDRIRSVFANAIVIFISLFLFLLVLFIIFSKLYFKENTRLANNLIPLLFFIPLSSIYDGLYRGLKRFKELSIGTTAAGLIAITSAFFLIPKYGIIGSIYSQNTLYALTCLILILMFGKIDFSVEKKLLKKVAKYSFLIGIANIGSFLYVKIDILVLGWFSYFKQIAFYDLSNNIFMLLALPVSILSQVIAPEITRKFSTEKNYNNILKDLKKYLVATLLIGSLVSLFFYFSIPFLIQFLFPKYNQELFYYYFYILLIIFPIRIFGSILAEGFIISTGNAKILTVNNLLFGITNFIMDIVFIYMFGYKGVMVSTFLLGYISVLIAYYRFKKIAHKYV